MKKREEYRPVSHGRASICTWSLEFRFLLAEQRNKFLTGLLNQKEGTETFVCGADSMHIETWEVGGDSFKPSEFWVKIHEHSWSNNLVSLAKLLQTCDYHID